jgi:hypothetical protein
MGEYAFNGYKCAVCRIRNLNYELFSQRICVF